MQNWEYLKFSSHRKVICSSKNTDQVSKLFPEVFSVDRKGNLKIARIDSMDMIDLLGRAGWKLVAAGTAGTHGDYHDLYFKRPISSNNQ